MDPDTRRCGRLPDLISDAVSRRLTGAVLISPISAELPEELMSQLSKAHDGAMLWCMLIELRLIEIKQWFDAAGGIEFRVLKGPAVAHLDEIDPSLRSFADLDLLISPDDMDRALTILGDHGAVRRLPEQRPGWDRRFGKGVGTRFDDGIEIDIHRTITSRAHGFRIPVDDLFRDPEPFVVGGETFLAMSRPHRALHAAYHLVAVPEPPTLHTARDLAGFLSKAALGPEVLVPIAERWGGLTVLAEAVELTLATFAISAPSWRAWSASVTIDRAEADLLSRGRTAIPWPIEWTTIRELGWLDRARFAWAVAAPSRAYRIGAERETGVPVGLVRRRAEALARLARRGSR
jgi:hypothetical protein